MDKVFFPAGSKREAGYSPLMNQPLCDSGEELNIILDMGCSEDHALTALRISDGTIRGTISVTELYKDTNALASNINDTSKVDSSSDAMNNKPGVTCE